MAAARGVGTRVAAARACDQRADAGRLCMRGWVGALAVLVALLVPSVARAQDGTIAGTVRDASGAVLPGVTVEASSPALIEKVRSVTTDGHWTVQHRRAASGHLHADVHAARLQRRPAGEHPAHRRHHREINAELRVGDLQETVTVTGESPIVDTRSAQPPAGDRRRRPPDAADVALLQRRAPARARRRGRQRPGAAAARHAALHGARRQHAGRPPDGRRHQHRRVARRRRRVGLHPRHAERPGSHLHHLRQPRRGGDRRPADDSHPQGRAATPSAARRCTRASTTRCRATTTTTSS